MIDYHVHSRYSSCCQPPMDIRDFRDAMRRKPELSAIYVTDHGFGLSVPEEARDCESFWIYPEIFEQNREWGRRRVEEYIREYGCLQSEGIHLGVETEVMLDGRFCLDESFLDSFELIIGSVHPLPLTHASGYTDTMKLREWRRFLGMLMEKPIHILAHPFRWLSTVVPDIPDSLVLDVVEAAGERGVALEINSHRRVDADARMLEAAIRRQVPVVFCTDAHRPEEIGDFSYQFSLMERLGVSMEDLVLWQGPRKRNRVDATAPARGRARRRA